MGRSLHLVLLGSGKTGSLVGEIAKERARRQEERQIGEPAADLRRPLHRIAADLAVREP